MGQMYLCSIVDLTGLCETDTVGLAGLAEFVHWTEPSSQQRHFVWPAPKRPASLLNRPLVDDMRANWCPWEQQDGCLM